MQLIFIVGLTGVGKSSSLNLLKKPFILLPNRRELTDSIIIPYVQEKLGHPSKKIDNRLERFELTGAYRQIHPSGMVHALEQFLANRPDPASPYLFDNIRGLDEVKAAHSIPYARFIAFTAKPLIRLERLLTRNDSFDKTQVQKNARFLNDVQGWEKLFKEDDLLTLQQRLKSSEAHFASALEIILSEAKYYDHEAALQFLSSAPKNRLLALDTSHLAKSEVAQRIDLWL